MKVKIMGSGCPTCKALYEKVKKLAQEGKIKAEIEYSSDINELISQGVMGSPAIMIDGKVVKVGKVSDEQLYKILGIN